MTMTILDDWKPSSAGQDLLDAIDAAVVFDHGEGSEVLDYSHCFLAHIQTADGTLPRGVRYTIRGQKRVACCLAALDRRTRRALWEKALAGHLSRGDFTR